MKKVLISMLVLSSLVTMVGCGNKSTATDDSDKSTATNEQVENRKRSNEEMYKVYEELLPKVKSYYESLGVSIEEEKSQKCKDYDGNTYISYRDYDNKNVDEFSVVDYGLSFDQEGEIRFILGSMYMNIDESFYKDGNFKFEETPFYELSKLFGMEDLDYTSVNEKVNDYFKGNGSDLIHRNKGQFSERINLGQSQFAYIININP